MIDHKKELQRVFEFFVKNNNGTVNWPNKDIRKMLRWAWFYKKIFIIYAPSSRKGFERIAACDIAWRTDDLSIDFANMKLEVENTEFGDNLCILQVIVHPEFKDLGIMLQLLSMNLYRFPGVKKVFWRDRRNCLRILNVNKLALLLYKGARKKCPVQLHQKSQTYNLSLSRN